MRQTATIPSVTKSATARPSAFPLCARNVTTSRHKIKIPFAPPQNTNNGSPIDIATTKPRCCKSRCQRVPSPVTPSTKSPIQLTTKSQASTDKILSAILSIRFSPFESFAMCKKQPKLKLATAALILYQTDVWCNPVEDVFKRREADESLPSSFAKASADKLPLPCAIAQRRGENIIVDDTTNMSPRWGCGARDAGRNGQGEMKRARPCNAV
jgi:hypothetical protein